MRASSEGVPTIVFSPPIDSECIDCLSIGTPASAVVSQYLLNWSTEWAPILYPMCKHHITSQ